MRERVIVFSLSVSHSVTQQKVDLKNGSLLKIEISIQNVVLDHLSPFDISF